MSLIVRVNSKNGANGTNTGDTGGEAAATSAATNAVALPAKKSLPTSLSTMVSRSTVHATPQPPNAPHSPVMATSSPVPPQQQQPQQPQPQPSTITITSIAEQQTAAAAAVAAVAQQQHIVQHHPPALAPVVTSGDARYRMIQVPQLPQLPQSPVPRGHSPITVRQPVRLPQSPVKQSQLSTMPMAVSHMSAQRLLAQQQPAPPPAHSGQPQPLPGVGSAAAAAGIADRGRPRQQQLIVNASRFPSPAHTLSMLPQTPSPGMLPTTPSPDVLPPGGPTQSQGPSQTQRNIVPYPPSNLVPPMHSSSQQQQVSSSPSSSAVASKMFSSVAASSSISSTGSVLQHHLLTPRQHHRMHHPSAVAIRGLHSRSRLKNNSSGEQLELSSDASDLRAAAVAAAAAAGQVRLHLHPQQQHGGGRVGSAHVRNTHQNSPRVRANGGHASKNQIWQQCVALQDHNYASRPPPTPPPSPGTVAAVAAQQAAIAAVAQEAAIAAAVSAASTPSTLLCPQGQPTLARVGHQIQQQRQLQRQHQHQHPPHLAHQHRLPPPPPPAPHPVSVVPPSHSSSTSFSAPLHTTATDLLAAAALANASASANAHPNSNAHSHSSLRAESSPPITGASHSPLPPEPSPASVLANSVVVSGASPVSPLCHRPSTREEQNSASIEEAGVGPMVPLLDTPASSTATSGGRDGRSASDDEEEEEQREVRRRQRQRRRRGSSNEEAGEETETAPEADQDDEEEDDSITRCICDFLHDDGYMICCDKCSVWQHVVCMGLDRHNIPDEYLCEVCKPRPVDRKRARALQSRRRTEIFPSSSDDDTPAEGGKLAKKKVSGKKVQSRKPDLVHAKGKVKVSGKLKLGGKLKERPGSCLSSSKEDRKKQRKRKPSEKSGGEKRSTKKMSARRPSYDDDDGFDDDDEGDSEFALLEPRLEDSQQLRSWIDQYEEAVTNHYSPELRARLAGSKLSNVSSDLRPSAIGSPSKCIVSLKGNGVKILTASTNVPINTPVIECKGRLMLATQFRLSSPFKSKAGGGNSNNTPAHVFFYRLTEHLEICVDGRTFGNDARFCRRSRTPNAELRHILDKGSLHLFIVAVKGVEKNSEILLPLETHGGVAQSSEPLQSINADLREINKRPVNGTANNSSGEDLPAKEKIVKKKEKKKVKKSGKEKQQTPVKTKTKKSSAGSKTVPDDVDDEDSLPASESEINGENDSNNMPTSPSKGKPSPGKLGLPDNSGLIVGVNTINYDASSSVKNKAKSREERKMEMIMKAIEAMERAEQRKREHTDTPTEKHQTGSKRRRSNSTKTNSISIDVNLDASSADEGLTSRTDNAKKLCKTKKGRKSGPSTPQRRRSRVLSGESASAVSETETGGPLGNESSSTPNTANSTSGPFRFPKTKKSLMTDWLESEAGGAEDDDDVSGSYLRGSRSPPGIATHLLRSAPHSPVKSVCSATKKRWLRQAISEDHSEENPVMVNGGSPTESTAAAPLKKRRLASYKDDIDQQEEEGSPSTTASSGGVSETAGGKEDYLSLAPQTTNQPNSLKKKLLTTMVVEAVLDKAMEDYLGAGSSSSGDTRCTDVAETCVDTAETPDVRQENISIKKDFKEESEITRQPKQSERESNVKSLIEKFEGQNTVSSSSLSPLESQNDAVPGITSPTIKTPEPSQVFKSFFKPTVSIEDLEKKIEATKKQREELNLATASSDVEVPTLKSEPQLDVQMDDAKEMLKSEKDLSLGKEIKQNDTCSSVTTKEENPLIDQPKPGDFIGDKNIIEKNPIPDLSSDANSTVIGLSTFNSKPKEKRRVSLADYKRRRKQDGGQRPSNNSATDPEKVKKSDEGTSTPTLDEQLMTRGALPTLNTLPLFEKLEQLEQQQKANKSKAPTAVTSGEGLDEEVTEPKREDLTERLKKEFGLTVDEDSDTNTTVPHSFSATTSFTSNVGEGSAPMEEGDSTPELDGGSKLLTAPLASKLPSAIPGQPMNAPPHPPPVGYSGSSSAKAFTPTQYPSYPSNFPVAPYPKGNVPARLSVPPHPPPHSGPSETGSSSGTQTIPRYPPPSFPRSSLTGPREYPKEEAKRRDYHTSSSSASISSSHSPGNRSYFEQRGGSRGSDGRDRDLRRDYHREHYHRERDHHYRSSSDKRDSRQRHGDRGSSSSYRGYYGNSHQ